MRKEVKAGERFLIVRVGDGYYLRPVRSLGLRAMLEDVRESLSEATRTSGLQARDVEQLFLMERLPPWRSNRLKRLVRTPKLHLSDTGTVAALLDVDGPALAADRPLLGRLLETFVFQELRRQASWQSGLTAFFHFRDRDGVEMDLVIERGAHELAGVEVRAGATVTPSDFRGLRRLRETVGKRFAAGVVLYDGETCAGFGDGLYAVPIRSLWEAA